MSSLLRMFVRPFAIRTMVLREWWQSGVTYNPLSPHVYLNPYPKYAQLRAKDPVHWSPLMDAWVVARYAHVDAILRDHKRFSNDPRHRQRRVPRHHSGQSKGPEHAVSRSSGPHTPAPWSIKPLRRRLLPPSPGVSGHCAGVAGADSRAVPLRPHRHPRLSPAGDCHGGIARHPTGRPRPI